MWPVRLFAVASEITGCSMIKEVSPKISPSYLLFAMYSNQFP